MEGLDVDEVRKEAQMARILTFAGSLRSDSYNRRLVRIAAGGAEDGGATVTLIELANYPMPLMDEDLETNMGIPEKALEFKRLMLENDGLLIASPEYNSSITPLLKNALDWASRSESSDERPIAAYRDKIAVIMSASPGNLGGLRGLVVLRMLLGNLGVTVLPDQRCISGASEAFAEDGSLLDPRQQSAVKRLGMLLAQTVDRLHGES